MKEAEVRKAEQDKLDEKFDQIDIQAKQREDRLLEEIRNLRDEKDSNRSRSDKDEFIARVESMSSGIHERIRDIEGRMSDAGGDPALRVELAKLNKQSEVLTKTLANGHDTFKTAMQTYVEMNKESPVAAAQLPAQQFTAEELAKMEKQLKKKT